MPRHPHKMFGPKAEAMGTAQTGRPWRIVSTRMPAKRGMFDIKFQRGVWNSETQLPKGGSGKILKSALRECFWIDQKRALG
jgi:hypothetical protein